MILATVLDQAGDQFGGFLPRVGGVLLLLVVGLILVRILARIVRRALQMAGLDSTADRLGFADVLERAGLGRSLAHVIAVAVRIFLTVVVVFAALSLLGMQFLSQSLNEGVLFLPKLLAEARRRERRFGRRARVYAPDTWLTRPAPGGRSCRACRRRPAASRPGR